jgi:hypothetical protein
MNGNSIEKIKSKRSGNKSNCGTQAPLIFHFHCDKQQVWQTVHERILTTCGSKRHGGAVESQTGVQEIREH